MENITNIKNNCHDKNKILAKEIKYYQDKITKLNDYHKSDLIQLKTRLLNRVIATIEVLDLDMPESELYYLTSQINLLKNEEI